MRSSAPKFYFFFLPRQIFVFVFILYSINYIIVEVSVGQYITVEHTVVK